MEVVDAHIHLWTPETHTWLKYVKPFEKIQNYQPGDFFADCKDYHVTRAVHVQAEWTGDPVQETKYLMDLSCNNDQRFPHAMVGYCDLSSPNASNILTQHKEAAGEKFVGVRQLLSYHPTKKELRFTAHDNFLTDKNWIDGVGLLGQHNLTYDFNILPHQALRAVDVVKKYPEVTFVLEHCLSPYERDETALKVWQEGLTALASCANVVVKVSGMFGADPQWTPSSAMGMMNTVINKFGIARCMFASNFPVDKLHGSYSQLVELHRKVVAPYTPQEQCSYFSGLASKVYRVQ